MNRIFRTFSRSKILARNAYVIESFQKNLADSSSASDNIPNRNELIKLDPIELATGMYKRDILDKINEDDDPYSVKMLSRVEGTKEKPNMIPSAFESRMVGCVCEEDSDSIVWMWLHKGEPKRCQCGHWFQLHYQPTFENKSNFSS